MFTQYSLYLIYALLSQIQLCRNSALFGEALLAKIWWGEAQKHFKGPGLHSHMYEIGQSTTKTCQQYGFHTESTEHYLLDCHAFANVRVQLFQKL